MGGQKIMIKHSHNFVETYKNLVGFGLNRETDENTVVYCLQKFSDDSLMEVLKQRMTDQELEEVFELISKVLKKHLSEKEYHRYYLKEG
jgi:hypothetical protein